MTHTIEPAETTQALSGGLRGSAGTPDGLAVPWGTLVPIALVVAFADGFWKTSLRGAVGAIERTASPTTTWLLESMLSVPLFLLATLLAMTLTLWRFGPRASSVYAVATGGLLVVLGCTLVGVGQLVVDAGIDYRLQTDLLSAQSQHLSASGLAAAQSATLDLQVRAVAYAAVILLVTNLVLVAWLIALRGGRLELSRRVGTRARQRATTQTGSPGYTVVTALLGSALIHAAVVDEHLEHWWAAGVFFLVLACAQTVTAVVVLRHVNRESLLAVVVLCAVPLLIWLLSRTVGLSFVPAGEGPEAVGAADVAASLLEVIALVGAVRMLPASVAGAAPHRAVSGHRRAVVVTALAAVTTLGIGGTSIASTGGDGPSPDHGTSSDHELHH